MRHFIAAAALVVGVVTAFVVYAQSPAGPKKPPAAPAAAEKSSEDLAAFMRLKLEHSQKALEGLAVEDFKLIAQHAQKMALLVEDENWMVLKTPEYRRQSAQFQDVANRLTAAAREENLDGAALAYIDMTMSCVNCHKYLRGARAAK